MARTWDPGQYLKFHGPRIRPALDLLGRIAVDAPKAVYDLGCGPGKVAGFIRDRWPEARLTGVDSSDEMLAKAREAHPDVTFEKADLADWTPADPADVLYSNAVFQWLGDHDRLFPRLAGLLRLGGVLAFQMPRNWSAPSHTIMHDLVAESPWRTKLEPHLRHDPVSPPAVYFDLLQPLVSELDIWETEYLQILDGDNAVAEWTKGTALKPLLDALDADQEAEFFRLYSARMQDLYPRRADGKTLYPFRRLFVVARV
ncbi:MAG: methyltransferase domain-containing protein [Rhodospirillaceae bacterium]